MVPRDHAFCFAEMVSTFSLLKKKASAYLPTSKDLNVLALLLGKERNPGAKNCRAYNQNEGGYAYRNAQLAS